MDCQGNGKMTKGHQEKGKAKKKDDGTEEVPERKVSVQQYKGLGEMNPSQLWETTMDPASRVMLRVTIDDTERADDTFEILMGSEVAPRKRYIQTHAKSVKNLDV